MLALLPEEHGADQTLKAFKRVDVLRGHDQTLRGLIHTLNQIKDLLAGPWGEDAIRGARSLKADTDPRANERLGAFIADMVEIVQAYRKDNVIAADIDAAALNELRLAIEKSIVGEKLGLDVFSNFEIGYGGDKLENHTFRFAKEEKGFFTAPVMANVPSNHAEFIADRVTRYMEKLVWVDFGARPRTLIDTPDEDAFFGQVSQKASELAADNERPVLFVRDWKDPWWIEGWRQGKGRRLTRRESISDRSYLGTIEGVDLFRGDFGSGRSLLFPASLLSKVRFGRDPEGKLIAFEFVPDEDPVSGTLVVKFSQATDWRDAQVFELRYSTSEGGRGEDANRD